MAYNDMIIKRLMQSFDEDKKNQFTNCALMFAYNGTGKTRLSYDFAHYGRKDDSPQHTLYYNAYTEDLFTWDNHIEDETEDREHHLLINTNSSLIQGLAGYDFEDKLRKYLHVFTDIDFDFHYDDDNEKIPSYVTFNKTENLSQELNGEMQIIEYTAENIKISRGEERLFVWCFFRCILDQVIGGNDAYKNIVYIYIDDPMSSLDDNNVIAFAQQLYNVIRQQLQQELSAKKAGKENFRRIRFIVSSHHALFFHVMLHGLNNDRNLGRYYLHRIKQSDELVLKSMSDTDKTPFFYNVAIMSEIQNAIRNDKLYTYHFTVMRSVMEKIAEFFGHFDYRYILDGITYKGNRFEESLFSKGELADLYSRIVNVFSHQGSFFAPSPMNEDNKDSLKTLFFHIRNKYHFLLPDLNDERSEKVIHSPQNKK
ncbi:MAG: hypothetical protein K6F47_10410 [Bacteroidaceae bacterium]|nr:hypothetical protein [Bacteroidaceae bacterium]